MIETLGISIDRTGCCVSALSWSSGHIRAHLCFSLMVRLKNGNVKQLSTTAQMSGKDKYNCKHNRESLECLYCISFLMLTMTRYTCTYHNLFLSKPLPAQLAESTKKHVWCVQKHQPASTENHLTMEMKHPQTSSNRRESGL